MRISLALLVLTSLGLAGCDRFAHTVKIRKETIQTVVDKMVPVDAQKKGDLPFPASLQTAEVLLDESTNQMGLRISFSTQPPVPPNPKPPGAPPFAPPGAPTPPTSPNPEEPIEGILSLTGEVSFNGEEGSFYFRNPTVREFEAGDLPTDAAKPLKQAVEKLVGKYLDEHPVYTLEDGKLTTKAAKALLKSVAVKDNALHVTIGL